MAIKDANLSEITRIKYKNEQGIQECFCPKKMQINNFGKIVFWTIDGSRVELTHEQIIEYNIGENCYENA